MTTPILHALRVERPSTLTDVAYRLATGEPVDSIPYPLNQTAGRIAAAYASLLPDGSAWRDSLVVMSPAEVGAALHVCWRADAVERRWVLDAAEGDGDAAYERVRDAQGVRFSS